MRDHEDELRARNASAAVVSFDSNLMVDRYVEETELPWPLLLDRERKLYHAFDMHRGKAWNLVGPAAMWAYFKLLLRGKLPKKGGEDVAQLGGDVLIDPGGIVRLHHVSNGPAGRVSIEGLLAAIE